MSKGLTKEIKETQRNVLKTIETAVKGSVGGISDDAADLKMKQLLAQLRADHNEVALKIRRKAANSSTYGLFVTLEGLPIEQVGQFGVDAICQEEGGDGTYLVDVVANGKPQGTVGPVVVAGGVRHEQPKALRESTAKQNPFGLPFPGMNPGGIGPVQTGPGSANIKDFAGYMQGAQRDAQQNNDRVLSMMQMSQAQQMAMMQQAQQQQNQMLMAMFGMREQERQGGGNTEVEALKKQIEMMQMEQRQSAALAELKAEIASKGKESDLSIMMPLILKSMDGSGSAANQQATMMATMMQAMQQSSTSQQETMWKAMSMMMDKPPEDERLRGMMDTMSSGMMNLFGVMGQLMSSGLLGGDNKSTVAQLVEKAADIAAELGVAALNRQNAHEAGPAQVMQQQQQIPEAMPAPAAPMGELPAHDEPQQGEMYDLSKDPGLNKIIELIEGEGSPAEISGRIWAHKNSGHRITAAWWENPEYGVAIMSQIEIPEERIIEVTTDLVRFKEHLDQGGTPNAWCADTGYVPQKKVASGPSMPPPQQESVNVTEIPEAVDGAPVYSPQQPPDEQLAIHRIPGDGSMTEQEIQEAMQTSEGIEKAARPSAAPQPTVAHPSITPPSVDQ